MINVSKHIIKNPYVQFVCVVLVFFLLLTAFWNQPYFESDEGEIFMVGSSIAQGQRLYSEVPSQHMPVIYYIAALFNILGASTYIEFRICFYLMMAFIWGMMFLAYHKKFGKITLILYPVIYIFVLSHMDFTARCILADQFQGIGMAILLFELLQFFDTRTIRITNCIMISLAVLISFGFAFVSVFAIFAIFMTVLMLEVRDCVAEKKRILRLPINLLRKYWKLIVIVLVPFIFLVFYYLVVGDLGEFLGWAYMLNRTVYPRYIPYGEDIWQSMIGGYSNYLAVFQNLNLSANCIYQLILVLLSLAWGVQYIRKKRGGWILTLGIIFFAITCATRGLFIFHGLPAVAILCVMTACFINDTCKKNHGIPNLTYAGCVISLLILAMPYCKDMLPNLFSLNLSPRIEPYSTSWYIDEFTDEGEGIGFSLLNNSYLIDAEVHPAVTTTAVPWYWDWDKEDIMAELHEKPPRLFVYSPSYEVWGYTITDYAPELNSFIQNNYTSLDMLGQPMLWIINDEYDDVLRHMQVPYALSKAQADYYPVFSSTVCEQQITNVSGMLTEIYAYVGTYVRTNHCSLKMELIDENENSLLCSVQLDAESLTDNSYASFSIPAIQLLPDHSYRIKLSSPDANDNHFVAIGAGEKNVDNSTAYYDGTLIENSYNIMLSFSK